MAASAVFGQGTAKPRPSDEPAVLELRLAEMRQIFNSMDPAPFRERELDPKATDYIVDRAGETPKRRPLALVVHVGQQPVAAGDGALIGDAVGEYFRGRPVAKRRELSRMFRIGRVSLVIGPSFLGVAIAAREAIGAVISQEGYAWLLKESLVIGGRVALWRPLEAVLYDWWPIAARARLYDRLGAMQMSIRGPAAPAGQAA